MENNKIKYLIEEQLNKINIDNYKEFNSFADFLNKNFDVIKKDIDNLNNIMDNLPSTECIICCNKIINTLYVDCECHNKVCKQCFLEIFIKKIDNSDCPYCRRNYTIEKCFDKSKLGADIAYISQRIGNNYNKLYFIHSRLKTLLNLTEKEFKKHTNDALKTQQIMNKLNY